MPVGDEEAMDEGDKRAGPLLAAAFVPGVGECDGPKDGDLVFAAIALAVFAGSLGVESGVRRLKTGRRVREGTRSRGGSKPVKDEAAAAQREGLEE